MTSEDKVRAITEATELAAHQAVEQHDPKPRRWRLVVIGAGVVLAASLLSGSAYALWRINQLQGQADHNAWVAHQLGDQVRDLGATPRVPPPAPVDDPDPNDPDPVNDPDPDDPERQDPEQQDPEQQDPDPNDPDPLDDPEPNDPDPADDPDPNDDPDPVDDPDPNDPDPVDDPDPNDPQIPPAGWTWVDGTGRTQSCTRTGGTDTAPTYTCTAQPPETTPLPVRHPTVLKEQR